MKRSKEWWLAIGALSGVVSGDSAALAQEARAGVVADSNPSTLGQRAGLGDRTLLIGADIFREERVSTDTEGLMQMLFLDESALTLGPNSSLVIDRFVYDAQARTGSLDVSSATGVIRVVGGAISKRTPINVRTAAGTISVRGGISVVNADASGAVSAVFLFGNEMTVTGTNGAVQRVTRNGYGVRIAGPGAAPGLPERFPESAITGILSRLEVAGKARPSPTAAKDVAPLKTHGSGAAPGTLSPTRVSETTDEDDRRMIQDRAQKIVGLRDVLNIAQPKAQS